MRYHNIPRKFIARVIYFALFFAMGVTFHRYVHISDYVRTSDILAFINSPMSSLQAHARGWDSLKILHYTQDDGSVHFRRYAETGLLPVIINGKRLSDSYPVAKVGGAITVVDTTVIILDRLGSLYRYDLTTGAFEPLQFPRLPNNLEAFLLNRPVNLAVAPNDQFRAHDIAFLPDRRELAVAYDKVDMSLGKLRTAVSVIPIDVATLAATGAWQELFTSDPYSYGQGITSAGGRMAYRGDGKLYLTLGDHYTVEPKVSQTSNTTFGKIIEIDITAKEWHEISRGHRNPQGLTLLKSGQLLSTEHGPRGGDELNIISEGSNYGWPNVTLGTAYDSYDWDAGTSPVGSHAGYTAPLFAWVPSIAVSQLIEINNFHARWNGDLLVGSLKASSLYRLRLEAGRVLYSEPIWIGQRIRDLAKTKDGTIVLWTNDTQLLFVTVDNDQLAQKRRMPAVVSDPIVNAGCMACHHFGPTSPGDFAPSLSNLLNRPIASDAFRYSAGLRAKQGNWTAAQLSEFLADPAKFANGTNMLSLGLDQEQIKEIVDVLVQASDPLLASSPSQ
jgi:glucose/arabinose dehydrogenase/cytochrome c2